MENFLADIWISRIIAKVTNTANVWLSSNVFYWYLD